jgi:hypothetical protein
VQPEHVAEPERLLVEQFARLELLARRSRALFLSCRDAYVIRRSEPPTHLDASSGSISDERIRSDRLIEFVIAIGNIAIARQPRAGLPDTAFAIADSRRHVGVDTSLVGRCPRTQRG